CRWLFVCHMFIVVTYQLKCTGSYILPYASCCLKADSVSLPISYLRCQEYIEREQGFLVYPSYRESPPSNNWSASWGWAQKCLICEATLLTSNQSMSARIPPFKAAN